jgi:hypothetical protein
LDFGLSGSANPETVTLTRDFLQKSGTGNREQKPIKPNICKRSKEPEDQFALAIPAMKAT